jgi:predicted Zn-dependent protease
VTSVACLRRRGITLAAVLLLAAAPAIAAPFVPAADSEVLERVRPSGDPVARELRVLAGRLRDNPGDQPTALELARKHLVIARTTSDPRHVGYAEVALRPWLELAEPPPAVRLLRATIRQSRHEFDAALADLDAVLALAPGHPQALLTRATVRLVRADIAGAGRDCRALARRAGALVVAACQASVDAASGQARRGAATLQNALASAPDEASGVRSWALTALAESFMRIGDAAAAEASFREALALDPDDVYTRAALADLLLDAGRPAEARAVVGHDLGPDALLLRAALTAQATAAADADALIGLLLDRMEAATRRGDTTHLREAARVRLDLLADPRRALELAQRNFAIQREPADALLLLRTAQAARQPDAAGPALAWLDATGNEDPAIRAAAAALRPAR